MKHMLILEHFQNIKRNKVFNFCTYMHVFQNSRGPQDIQ